MVHGVICEMKPIHCVNLRC